MHSTDWAFSRFAKHFTYSLSIAVTCSLPQMTVASDLHELKAMSLEELADLEVSIVGKHASKLSDTAAAVFVITAEDIRRSTATRLPELLRMVPGLNVARLDESEWAISARGFNSRFANKLLVMIDGRSVYTPFYSGTIWETQDLVLEDIERIEVVRGPGAATWGANAVNGVINIITKSADETQGTLASGLLGDEQNGAWLRHGFKSGKAGNTRVYAKTHHHEPFTNPDGSASDDNWMGTRAGFRHDLQSDQDDYFTLQGDAFTEETDSIISTTNLVAPLSFYGVNLLGRWDGKLDDDLSQSLQFYFDRTGFSSDSLGREQLDIIDLELHQEYSGLTNHTFSYGLGYRWMDSDFTPESTTAIDPDTESTTDLVSAFIQDDIQLIPEALKLTLGMKLEHNDYTGFEYQPNIRMNWHASDATTLWGAVSRAVRTPSRFEHDIIVISDEGTWNGMPIVNYGGGDPDFDSEEVIAYELGLKGQPGSTLSYDLALFYNKYDNLRSFEVQEPVVVPPQIITRTLLGNYLNARTFGLELATDWRPSDRWRVQLAYSFLRMLLDVDSASNDTNSESEEDLMPRHQLSLHTAFDVDTKTELDMWAYYASETPDEEVAAYFTLDLRLARRLSDRLTLELVGRNLTDPHHIEFGKTRLTPLPKQVDREVFLKLTWRS